MSDKKTWINHLSRAVEEMVQKKIVLLKRGDLIKEEQFPLFRDMLDELIKTKKFLSSTEGNTKQAYRYLQLNVFMPNESFFMDLFETNEFPHLFELFELE